MKKDKIVEEAIELLSEDTQYLLKTFYWNGSYYTKFEMIELYNKYNKMIKVNLGKNYSAMMFYYKKSERFALTIRKKNILYSYIKGDSWKFFLENCSCALSEKGVENLIEIASRNFVLKGNEL